MIKAKKSLGQNFLVDKTILEKIVNITEIRNKTILEIGPGTGNLTSYILKQKPKKIFVVEKDTNLSNNLRNIFNDQLIIINKDILKIDENIISEDKVTVFGNLPYNISTEILSKWIINLKDHFWFNHLILMFQKEVADRILAETNSKNYGRLAVLSSWKLQIKKIIDVSPNSFYPIPKVKSSVLLIKPKSEYFNLKNSKNLEHVTNIFFNQRRKMIKKPLNIIFKNVDEVSKKLNININDRPQNLSPLKYLEICNEYESLNS